MGATFMRPRDDKLTMVVVTSSTQSVVPRTTTERATATFAEMTGSMDVDVADERLPAPAR